jgi:flotillin
MTGSQLFFVPLMVLFAVVAVIVAIALFTRNFIKVPPNTCAVFSGRKRHLKDGTVVGFRLVRGGAALRWPVLERVDYLSLNSITFPLKVEAYNKDGVPVTIDSVATVKIASDDVSLRAAAERFLGMSENAIRDIIFQCLGGHLRGIMGKLTVEEANADRLKFAQQIAEEAATDLRKLGVQIDVLTIQHISDPRGYLEALGIKRTAEVKRDATIGEAEAQRDAMQRSAEAKRVGETARLQAEVAIAEQDKNLRVKKASYEAEVQAQEAQARQAGPLSEAKARQSVFTEEVRMRDIEAQRVEKELLASVVRPSEAQKEATIRKAEGDKGARVTLAEATQAELSFEGAGEAAKIQKIGEAEATKVRAIGTAEAEVIQLKLEAEAAGMMKKAGAWRQYTDAAKLQMLLEALPSALQAVAAPMAEVDRLVIVDSGGGGIGRLLDQVPATTFSFIQKLKEVAGIDLIELVKKSAATQEPGAAEAPPTGEQ